ncbi:DUF5009 domain-containing protein [Deinococcus sp.]|uniref:heparan-alpha-glucosaminide N-acetyltransferase domain-containing protein n=1 Tax=Deinococcus sp. TaxID=47478 RepID=UPI0025B9A626|nr:DUF5009 domain-containing protein [Deinococcus sp.]
MTELQSSSAGIPVAVPGAQQVAVPKKLPGPEETATQTPTLLPRAGHAPRLTALDAWRGTTVMLMLLVNNVALGEHTPAQLTHAEFGGLTLTDMVFPWFLFCAGAALPYSQAAMERAGISGQPFYRRLIQRAVTLYLVGAFVTSATEHRLTLGLGVLQLIALSTFFGALLAHLRSTLQLGVAATLLLGYAGFLAFGAHGGVGIISQTVNAVQAINDAVLSRVGLRGLLSVIPTTALVIFGSLAARPLQRKDPQAWQKLLALGGLRCGAGHGLEKHVGAGKQSGPRDQRAQASEWRGRRTGGRQRAPAFCHALGHSGLD